MSLEKTGDLAKWAAVLFIVFILSAFMFGCGGTAPAKPQIELCLLNVLTDENGQATEIYGDCGLTNSEKINSTKDLELKVVIKNMTDRELKPIEEMDKFIAMPPASWEKLSNYVDELVNYIRHVCK
jgi:hypothetical protein